MITVHHLENSRSQRILWVLEELGVPYEVKRYERNKTTMLAPSELKVIHPLGKSPVITDGAITVAETGAIIEYLVETYGQGKLVPKTAADRRTWTYWPHYAEGSAMTPFLLRLYFLRIPQNAPALIRPVARMISNKAVAMVDRQIGNHVAYWEQHLAKSPWFAGKALSAADIMMSFPLEVAAARSGITAYPKVAAFLQTIHARPAYQRALERGGPYGIIS